MYDLIKDKKLIFVTGKGGVGKTTITCALAMGLANQGKKVLAAEVSSDHKLKRIYENALKEESLPFDVMNIDYKEALADYILTQVKIGLLRNMIVSNKILKYFFDMAPGVYEVMVLYRLMNLCKESKYDHIIFDSPAFGHGLALLRAPNILRKFIKLGPLKTLLDNVTSSIYSESSGLVFVTLSKKTPIEETIDFYHQFQNEKIIPLTSVVANLIYPEINGRNNGDSQNLSFSKNELDILKFFKKISKDRLKNQKEQIEFLESQIEAKVFKASFTSESVFKYFGMKRIAAEVLGL
ncbi:MAG: ArsA family ATPase [Pseudomonadota bacterium]